MSKQTFSSYKFDLDRPTNTMRACTAVVTEISWNTADRAYRAEIEFISIEDWKKELTVLFKDLLDHEGQVSRDISTEDSGAALGFFPCVVLLFALTVCSICQDQIGVS